MDLRLSPYPGLRARHLDGSGRGWWLPSQRVRVLGDRDQLLPQQGRRVPVRVHRERMLEGADHADGTPVDVLPRLGEEKPGAVRAYRGERGIPARPRRGCFGVTGPGAHQLEEQGCSSAPPPRPSAVVARPGPSRLLHSTQAPWFCVAPPFVWMSHTANVVDGYGEATVAENAIWSAGAARPAPG